MARDSLEALQTSRKYLPLLVTRGFLDRNRLNAAALPIGNRVTIAISLSELGSVHNVKPEIHEPLEERLGSTHSHPI